MFWSINIKLLASFGRQNMMFELQNGRLNGLVQGFGLHFKSIVSGFGEDHPPEISLIAWYENGSLVPPFWRRNVESPHSESWTYVESEINDQVYILSANFTQVKKKFFNEAQVIITLQLVEFITD